VVRFSAWPLFCFWQLSSSAAASFFSSSAAAFTGSVVAFAAVAAGLK
jgi:hypothetical protein